MENLIRISNIIIKLAEESGVYADTIQGTENAQAAPSGESDVFEGRTYRPKKPTSPPGIDFYPVESPVDQLVAGGVSVP